MVTLQMISVAAAFGMFIDQYQTNYLDQFVSPKKKEKERAGGL